MKKPLVSVIMSVFNEQQYLTNAIESILSQTFSDFELIIIDDYSTDDSLQICKKFKDPRIRIYSKTDEPRGLAASRNIAINMARGWYIINQDADDIAHHQRIEKQLTAALQNPGRRVVGCSIKRIENEKVNIVTLPETHKEIINGFRRIYKRLTIVAGTILAPKKIMQDIPYRTRFRYQQDWDHMLRLYESRKVEFYNCPEPLYTHFIRPKGVYFKPGWLEHNIFIRNCQHRRRKGLAEFETIQQFFQYLDRHSLQKLKWLTIRELLRLNRRLVVIKRRLA